MGLLNKLKSVLGKIKTELEHKAQPEALNWSDVNVTLIVGSGRTGTGFFAKFFTTEFNDILALHEPYPDLFTLGTRSIRSKLPQKKVFNRILRDRFSYRKQMLIKKQNHFLESNNNYTLFLQYNLKKIFPNLKIIWVVRDPKTYVKSAYSKLHRGGTTRIFDENDGRNRLNSQDFDEDRGNYNWENMDRFEKICWHWYKYNSICNDAMKRNGQNMIMIKYEDLFSGDMKSMNEIIDFIHVKDLAKSTNPLDAMSRKANYSDEYIIDNFETWTEQQKEFFIKTTGPLAKELGY